MKEERDLMVFQSKFLIATISKMKLDSWIYTNVIKTLLEFNILYYYCFAFILISIFEFLSVFKKLSSSPSHACFVEESSLK